MVRATSFLHREYSRVSESTPDVRSCGLSCALKRRSQEYFWWEVVFLLQRITVVGFVQWISHTFLRFIFVLVTSSVYMVVLLVSKPVSNHTSKHAWYWFAM